MISLEPRFEDFAPFYAAGKAQLVWSRRISDVDTPVSALIKLGADTPGAFLLESVEGGAWIGRYSILGLKPDLVWRVREGRAEISRGGFSDAAFRAAPGRPLEALRALLAESRLDIPPALPPMAAGVFGYLGYDMIRHVENLPDCPPDTLGAPDAVLMRPTIVAVFDHVAQEIVLVTPVRPRPGLEARPAYEAAAQRLSRAARALDKRSPPPPESGPAPPGDAIAQMSNITAEEYCGFVERAKAYARAGDIFQVVPSQRFSAPFPHKPFALYRALRRLNPSPFLFYLHLDGFHVVGSSPEVLVRLRQGVVTVRPIAGTRPRGATPAEDAALEQDLLADPKERAEHLMLLDLGRNDVGRVAERGSGVRVTQNFIIERYSHVMHIVSNIEGRLAEGLDAVDALFAGFPAGTVSGAPKVRAMQIIDALEKSKRGVYGGGVGYISAGGDMDTCIALRTAVVKDGIMHVQAGGGVVLDSDPHAELAETMHKSKALFRAAEESWRFT